MAGTRRETPGARRGAAGGDRRAKSVHNLRLAAGEARLHLVPRGMEVTETMLRKAILLDADAGEEVIEVKRRPQPPQSAN
ncbi:hypothetical protein MNEG_14194, partial [Monoraphidium neglectum]